jgi:hypothetical protein
VYIFFIPCVRSSSTSPGGVLGNVVKQYKQVANWVLGWGVLETQQLAGVNSKNAAQIETKAIVIPLAGFLTYFADCERVAVRLERAGDELVRRWNAQQPKKVLDWKDEIHRDEWEGKDGTTETSIFETTLSTYAFFVSRENKNDAVITKNDLKVRSTRSTCCCCCGCGWCITASLVAGHHQAAHDRRLLQQARRARNPRRR